jgi:hypothetical protein
VTISDAGWQVTTEPSVLLPGRRAVVRVSYTPSRDHESRGAHATIRCVERYRYDTHHTSTDANGVTHTRTVTHDDEDELHRFGVELAGPGRFSAGGTQSWEFDWEVPGLGPPTFEGDVLRCDWTLETKADIRMRPDERAEHRLLVAQPNALLRAGVVHTGQYGLYEEAPANLDHLPAQIRLDPVPLCLGAPFSGAFTAQTAEPVEVQEVRLELRTKVEVTVSGGHEEEITVARGRLEQGDRGLFGGEFAVHRFVADATEAWLPSVDLPHGRARATFHVILARAWAPDIHYVRDVALATTTEL